MGIFYRTFIKVFAYISSIFFFILCFALIINFFENNTENAYFQSRENLDSNNKIVRVLIQFLAVRGAL